MKSKRFLTWMALCVLPAAVTNGLLVLHLLACHEGHSSSDSEPSSHSHQSCPICQVFLLQAGKYTIQLSISVLPAATDGFQSLIPSEERHSQSDSFPGTARSPPC